MTNAPEYGQGAGTLSKAAGMVAEARGDFNSMSLKLRDQIESVQVQWSGQGGNAFQSLGKAWTDRQDTIVKALNDFEASLQSAEKDNMSTDEQQGSTYVSAMSRLEAI